MTSLVWLVPLFPLLGFALLGGFNRGLSKGLATLIGCGSVLASFVVSVLIFMEQLGSHDAARVGTEVTLFSWIKAGGFSVDFGFLVDPLSSLFLLIITGVGFLIHVYSSAYMADDDGYRRFFTYLNLFVFFMLLLVLGNNYLVMFVGWEGVGLCSYLLIGYWFKNEDYNAAARKAFIMNRIGDLAFILGMILIYLTYGSLEYKDVLSNELALGSTTVITLITMLLFIGATGKSAQIPLYTWLPDAMAGPTPVSALIHAATMVTAGIYMIARSNVLFVAAPITMQVIAAVGLATALLGAVIGLYQNDIKKVLAYSTVSQLGLMFLSLGVGGFTAAVFHVTTHAFFKALLFLGAGSVIHAMHHAFHATHSHADAQDMRVMGGLRKHLPITFITMFIGTLAIAGVPPLAGFFSKDEIIGHVMHESPLLGWLAIGSSVITVFYMFRMLFLTFWGDFRGGSAEEKHLHESPPAMTIPLIVLAGLAAFSGLLGWPQFSDAANFLPNRFEAFLHPVLGASEHAIAMTLGNQGVEMVIITTLVLFTIGLTYWVYVTKGSRPSATEREMGPIRRLIYNKFYMDEIYQLVVTKPLDGLSRFAGSFVEPKVIDGFVEGLGLGMQDLGQLARKLQTGRLAFYFLAMVVGMAAIILYRLFI
jgi:NADH-quinone oxidoreductase subunit L